MGTVAEKLTYLNETKTAIKDAIVAKGVPVSDTDTFRSYAAKVERIPSGPATKYGVSIIDILGNVEKNGTYVFPTEPFTPDLSSIKYLPAGGLAYKFYESGASGDIVVGLEGDNVAPDIMRQCFTGCAGLTSVSFPGLTAIRIDALTSCFEDCTGLISASFLALERVYSGMSRTFNGCEKLSSVAFPKLAYINGSLDNCFGDCVSLTSISFPMLTELGASYVFGSSSGTYAFRGCTALKEIHFRADVKGTIESLNGYADKWGAANATIYFDL